MVLFACGLASEILLYAERILFLVLWNCVSEVGSFGQIQKLAMTIDNAPTTFRNYVYSQWCDS